MCLLRRTAAGIKENRIDIYVNDHATALELGVNYADVHLKK